MKAVLSLSQPYSFCSKGDDHGGQMLNELAEKIHQNAMEKGFWSDLNIPEKIALIHSELSEALEADRAGEPNYAYGLPWSDRLVDPTRTKVNEAGVAYVEFQGNKVPVKPEGAAVELVDAMIRILDLLVVMEVDIDEITQRKMAYNATREIRHGKRY